VPGNGILSGEIQWDFFRDRPENIRAVPIQYYSCKMSLGKIVTYGGGDSILSPKYAIIRAFCEAWERLWMQVLFNFNDRDRVSPIPTSSNGFAAGRNIDDAKANAKRELIERSAFLTAWQTMKGWNSAKFETVEGRIANISLKRMGWHAKLYTLTTDLPQYRVTVGIITHKKWGAYADAACSHTGNESDSEKKIFRSFLRKTKLADLTKKKASEKLPEFGSPVDHDNFYSNPIHLKAFDFLIGLSNSNTLVNLPNPDLIKFETFAPSANMPCLARAWHHEWPELRWGTTSISGKNTWPHPLA